MEAIIPSMGRRGLRALLYLVAGLAAGVGAVFVYPMFPDAAYAGLTQFPPTIVVIQEGAAGAHALSVDVRLEYRNARGYLLLDEIDQAADSQPGATTYVGVRRSRGGGEDSFEPLGCWADTFDDPEARIGTAPISDVWARAMAEGALGGSADLPGEVTTVTLDQPVTAFRIGCDLPEFRFTRESLANWNLYLPGVLATGIGGAEHPVIGYWVNREPSDYIVQVSQQPSEVLASYYSWYDRDFDYLARQGLFLTISNPSLQQEGAYRLFIAGALLGLSGSFVVAAAQTALGKD